MSPHATATTAVVINHGCKLNQCEGESLAAELERCGVRVHRGPGWPEPGPDLVIVNSCTVTGKADRKSRHSILRAARRVAPGGRVIVTGCYAQTDPDTLRAIPGVHLVVGGREKGDLVRLALGSPAERAPAHSAALEPFWFAGGVPGTRSRAFLKVQDGCDMRCSYCKVPLARGGSVSRDPAEVQAAAAELAGRGYREIVLTGVNLGTYRHGRVRLAGLLGMLLEELPGSCRIRLSSIEPLFFDQPLLEVIASGRRILPHFHIPLQSGSDRVLGHMQRPYTGERFLEVAARLRELRPGCHLALDVLVGFPSEREEDFLRTVEVVREAAPASLHVFRYSRREHTPAAALPDRVSCGEKARRSRMLIDLGEEFNYRYRRMFAGKVLEGVV
ncbi:MAG: MiaB/RimO family radical SAM methylthiotransferase, partial [Spirochaetota bacterium]